MRRSPLPTWLKSMGYDEFIALGRGLLRHPAKAISRRHRQAAPGADASAIHGRLGARVALLQSPILSAANPPYPQQTESCNVPVDNTHTCIPRVGPVRGYEYCQRGALEHSGRSCRTDGSGVTLRTCGLANPQVGFREMLVGSIRSHSPSMRVSTGAKHLHGDRSAYLSACKRLTRFRPPA
jgi:hypothetical protein